MNKNQHKPDDKGMVVAGVVTYGASTAVTTGAWAWGFGMAQGASAAYQNMQLTNSNG